MSVRDSVMNSVMSSQAALVSAIYGYSDARSFDEQGLAVYQSSLAANAERALAISFPTIQQLIGAQGFTHLSDEFLHEHPLTRGDWGDWGQEFPGWLSAHVTLQDYPYFRDSAQLDWYCHLSERAQDDLVDADSLALLAASDPYNIKLQYSDSMMLVPSVFPIVDIWNAHHAKEPKEQALAQAAQGLSEQQAQNALVWRPQWKAQVRVVTELECLWLRVTQQGESIGAALDQVQDSEFSFETWLPDALSQRIVCGIDCINNSTT